MEAAVLLELKDQRGERGTSHTLFCPVPFDFCCAVLMAHSYLHLSFEQCNIQEVVASVEGKQRQDRDVTQWDETYWKLG